MRAVLSDYFLGACVFLAFILPVKARAATECIANFPQCSATSSRVFLEGNRLSNVDDAWDTGWHDGFVMGVALSTVGAAWCTKTLYSGQQLSAVVAKFVQAHPELWNQQAIYLVTAALGETFPCAKSGTK